MMKSGKVRAVTVDHFAKFKNQYAELKDHKWAYSVDLVTCFSGDKLFYSLTRTSSAEARY
jgi:hypothetical protein